MSEMRRRTRTKVGRQAMAVGEKSRGEKNIPREVLMLSKVKAKVRKEDASIAKETTSPETVHRKVKEEREKRERGTIREKGKGSWKGQDPKGKGKGYGLGPCFSCGGAHLARNCDKGGSWGKGSQWSSSPQIVRSLDEPNKTYSLRTVEPKKATIDSTVGRRDATGARP